MMHLKDSTLLAYTKLRTRKVRLFVTIAISGLLLSGLAAGAFVARGAFASIESFSKEGFGDRYILSAQALSSFDYFNDSKVADRAVEIQKDIISRKKAAANKLGIEYDNTTETAVFSEYPGPEGRVKSVDPNTDAGKQAIAEYVAKHPPRGLTDLKKIGEKYGAKAYYSSPPSPLTAQSDTYLQVLNDGKEAYDKPIIQNNQFGQTGTASFSTQWGLMSGDLLKPFMLPGASLEVGADGSYPVVAPYLAVEQLLHLKPLPSNATNQQHLNRIKEVREGAKTLSFSVCYRNSTSQQQLADAINQQKSIAKDSKSKDYVKPDLIRALPESACGSVATTRDVRTSFTKDLAGKELNFRQQFGEPVAESKILSFRIIGIAADQQNASTTGVSQLLSGILSSTISTNGLSWFTSLEVADKSPAIAAVLKDNISAYNGPVTYFMELPDANSARKVLEKENCSPDYTLVTLSSGAIPPSDSCEKSGKYFVISPFGSSSLALDGVKKIFSRIFGVAVLIFAGIATFIMIGTVGRIIADSRRETSVFRAIGAKRSDIAQVYFTYTILLALLVCIFAIILGFIIASIVQAKYSNEFTISSIVIFNAQDLTKHFSLLRINIIDVSRLVLVTVGAGITSAILPLITNLRRSPINDMRDEN